MKMIQTLAKNRQELSSLVHALYAMGYECTGYTAESFTRGGYFAVSIAEGSSYISGNYQTRECNGKVLSIQDFLFEAAMRKFPAPLFWKIGCRVVEVGKDGTSLYLPKDDITIPKSQVQEMLEALK